MNAFVIANSGLETVSAQEIKELLKSKSVSYQSLVEFPLKKTEDLLVLFQHGQSFKRLAVSLGQFSEIDKLGLEKIDFNWKDFFYSGVNLKVEVENVSGNDNRIEISRKIMGQIFSVLEKNQINPQIDLKHPDVVVLVYSTGKDYFLGIDFSGRELNSRNYRVFASHSSFKGDHAYYFVRKSGFKPGENLLNCYTKDGAIALEAALFANKSNVRSLDEAKGSSFVKWQLFKEAELEKTYSGKMSKKVTKVFAMDESQQNIIAAKKNSALAGTKEVLEFGKYALDELDVKFSEKQFDRIICYLTNKDEEKLNEIFYQFSYLLKPKGTLLLITRKTFELSVSSKFVLKEEEEFVRGDSAQKIWVMERI